MNDIYNEVVFWKKNLFLLPSGKAGKEFVSEMSRLIGAFANATALEGIALKAVVVLQMLLLQKPSAKSKSHEHIRNLQRRLELWKNGRFEDLLCEGRSLQQRLHKSCHVSEEQITRVFTRLMIQGKVKSALRYLSDNAKGGVLSLIETVEGSGGLTAKELLHLKHPKHQPICESALLRGPVNDIPKVIFDRIDGSVIKSAAL